MMGGKGQGAKDILIDSILHPKGSTTISRSRKGEMKEQNTNATIGVGDIYIGGELQGEDSELLAGLNRDIGLAQEVTRDELTGGLDYSVTIDHAVVGMVAKGIYNASRKIVSAIVENAKTTREAVEGVNALLNDVNSHIGEVDNEIEANMEELNNPNLSAEERVQLEADNIMLEEARQDLQNAAMEISEAGVQFIREREGRVVNEDGIHVPYLDSAGYETIGYGHLITTPEERALYINGITEEQAMELLRQDINNNNRGIGNVRIPLNQSQYDALSAFHFNLGVEGLLRRDGTPTNTLNILNGSPCENCGTLEEEYRGFNRSGGRVDPGLTNRRNAELNLFNNGIYENTGQINNMYNYMNRRGNLVNP